MDASKIKEGKAYRTNHGDAHVVSIIRKDPVSFECRRIGREKEPNVFLRAEEIIEPIGKSDEEE